MESKKIIKPSTRGFEEELEAFRGYLLILEDKELRYVFREARSSWLENPTIYNTRKYRYAKEMMIERGLMRENIMPCNNQNFAQEYERS